jgi:hypothetical protein
MKKQSQFQLSTAILSVLSLLVLFPAAEWVRLNLNPTAYKFLSGYLLGSISAMAIEFLTHSWRMRKKGGVFASMNNPVERALLFLPLACILALGAAVWVVSWEGSTGVYFGIGVILAQGIVRIGLGESFRAEAQCSHLPTSS